MPTSSARFRPVWCAPAFLLLVAGCADAPPTSPGVDVAPDGQFSMHRSDGGWVLTASAAFYEIHDCWEIEARIDVTETRGSDRAATLELTYSVFGICGGETGLWYYDLTTEGVVAIDPSDVSINAGLRRASVDTEVIVFDFETVERRPIRVQAEWERSRGGRDQPVVATLDHSGEVLPQPPPATEPLTSFEAELARFRR